MLTYFIDLCLLLHVRSYVIKYHITKLIIERWVVPRSYLTDNSMFGMFFLHNLSFESKVNKTFFIQQKIWQNNNKKDTTSLAVNSSSQPATIDPQHYNGKVCYNNNKITNKSKYRIFILEFVAWKIVHIRIW